MSVTQKPDNSPGKVGLSGGGMTGAADMAPARAEERVATRLAAGVFRGVLEPLCCNPLDRAVTRLQTGQQIQGSIFRGGWQGTKSAIAGKVSGCILFSFSFGTCKTACERMTGGPSTTAVLAATAGATVIEGVVNAPIGAITQAIHERKQTMCQAYKDIVARGGNRALFKGVAAKTARNGVFYLSLMGIEHAGAEVYEKKTGETAGQDVKFGLALIGGMVGSLLAQPFDWITKRLRKGERVGKIVKTVREAGAGVMFSGCRYLLVRAGVMAMLISCLPTILEQSCDWSGGAACGESQPPFSPLVVTFKLPTPSVVRVEAKAARALSDIKCGIPASTAMESQSTPLKSLKDDR